VDFLNENKRIYRSSNSEGENCCIWSIVLYLSIDEREEISFGLAKELGL